MVWVDFKGARNATSGDSLLRYQKRFAGLVAEEKGRYHADPLLAGFGMLKVGELYQQQPRYIRALLERSTGGESAILVKGHFNSGKPHVS